MFTLAQSGKETYYLSYKSKQRRKENRRNPLLDAIIFLSLLRLYYTMEKENRLVIDVGTQSLRASVINRKGETLAFSQQKYPVAYNSPAGSLSVEQVKTDENPRPI